VGVSVPSGLPKLESGELCIFSWVFLYGWVLIFFIQSPPQVLEAGLPPKKPICKKKFAPDLNARKLPLSLAQTTQHR
jgi:hypothetical protein